MSAAIKAQVATKATKATKLTVDQVKQLVEVRAEITRLESLKSELTKQIEAVFGVDKDNKVSEFDTLTHHNIEFARLDWVSRKGVDLEKLARDFPEAYEACFDPKHTTYSVVRALFK
jgi:hypothetical protein